MKPLIVMVSADDRMVEIYKDLFAEYDFSLKDVQKGEKALKVIKEKKPFAVLVDMAIPGEDGFDVIGNMQKLQTLKKIPVVVLSHLSDVADVARARKLKVHQFCLKLHCHPERIVAGVVGMRE